MISVILPTYNRAKWLLKSIKSVIEQDYQEWELIVVDDCSPDNTGEIVKELAKTDARIRYIRNEVNKKLPASLNVGMRNAKGEYITWTSDDNLFKSNALSVMMNAMEHGPTDTGLVFAEYDRIDEAGNKVQTCNIPEDVRELYWENIIGFAFLYKREVIDKIGYYDENKFLIEDYDYWLRIADSYDVLPVRQSIYEARLHPGSLSATRGREVLKWKRKVLEENLNRKVDEYTKKNIYAELATISYNLDDFSEMKRYVEIARNSYPDIKMSKRVRRAMILGDTLTRIYKKFRSI
ncbi:Glycosyltransferase involved in cell wall bisynthesis [Selenomonas ruminantium]|uniref:Glycosyltransferase involved in cell wall bisynthesis n=1 Tax=Selenomonas ruminantium TaxID=971 RepID=A0A1M6TE99_SELRU|nr:glycosyltransferase family 2 protein [Selenomonas ruminantium]SHK55362.1 Glycosyltransferase involved in cell wall bisynthesis [Selenomonas ruminantium]